MIVSLRLQHLEQQQGENVREQKTTSYHEATTDVLPLLLFKVA